MKRYPIYRLFALSIQGMQCQVEQQNISPYKVDVAFCNTKYYCQSLLIFPLYTCYSTNFFSITFPPLPGNLNDKTLVAASTARRLRRSTKNYTQFPTRWNEQSFLCHFVIARGNCEFLHIAEQRTLQATYCQYIHWQEVDGSSSS